MEQKINDVLCDIRTELSNMRSEISDVKLELKNIQGDEDDKANLYELWDELSDLKSDVNEFKEEYKKRMDMLATEDGEEGALLWLTALHDRLVSIQMDVSGIKSMCAVENKFD